MNSKHLVNYLSKSDSIGRVGRSSGRVYLDEEFRTALVEAISPHPSVENSQRILKLEALLLACREQVDVEDRYVHDMAPIIEAMEALED